MTNNTLFAYIVGFIAIILVIILPIIRKYKRKKQLAYIENYTFPNKISTELQKRYPNLVDRDIEKVLKGLREYFIISRISGHSEIIAMPSQVVDMAWHEFILFTKAYADFCHKAFGKFHHHIPAEAMKSKTDAQYSLRLAWEYACKRENIYKHNPKKLPLLFVIDKSLHIEDGFFYTLFCKKNSDEYCVKNIGSTGKGGCGGSGGCGGGAGCGGHSGDGGCGGGGCGGGCGG